MVDTIARPDMMSDRPACDHHHADDHLHVLRLAVAAVAVLGEIVRARAFEVGTGDVVEHQVGLEAEEVAEPVVERHFDLVLGRVELIEGAVPGVELAGMDADPPALVPVGEEASPLAVADEVGLEPAGEAMLTGGGDEPVGDEHKGAVGERDTFGPPEFLIEDGPEAELVEQGPNDEDRPPGRGFAELGVVGIRSRAGEEPSELGEHFDEEVLPSEIGDDTLLDLTAFAVGFDDADVFVDGAAFGADFHGSRVHENHYHDGIRRIKGYFWEILGIPRIRLSLRFLGRCGRGAQKTRTYVARAVWPPQTWGSGRGTRPAGRSWPRRRPGSHRSGPGSGRA